MLVRIPYLVAAVLAAPLASCSSVLSDYPEDARPATTAFARGDFEDSAQRFEKLFGTLDSNEFLALAEAGMARHVGGDLEGAIQTWLLAAEELDSYGDRPTVSGRSVSEGALSLLLNDKTLPYDGEGFEAALLHAFLAWDFLRLGDLDGAMVEIKRSYQMETLEEGRYSKTYGMNRFARFMAALAQEYDAALDDARIDLERLAKEIPDHAAVRYSLERIEALQSPGRSAVARLAEIVVVYERGRMPEKVPHELVFQGPRSFVKFSVPGFGAGAPESPTMEVLVDGVSLGRTTVLESVIQVADENLGDRIGLLAAKAAARTVAKAVLIEAAAEAVEEKHGEGWGIAAGLLASLFASGVERADLRSWLTLPQEIQVLRAAVEPGEHHLVVRSAGGEEIDLGIVEFRRRRPVLIGARSLGGRLHVIPPAEMTRTGGGAGSAPPEPAANLQP